MTTQELLASLSQLEQDLQKINSARELVEKTAQSYAEAKADISRLLSEVVSVSQSLNSVATALDSENRTFSAEIKNSIALVKGELERLNASFSDSCDVAIGRFQERIDSCADSLESKTKSLSAEYEENNRVLKDRIANLTQLHGSIINAAESVASLKEDISKFEDQITQSKKDQDATLAQIASGLLSSTTTHAQGLAQISSDLRSLRDAQDSALTQINTEQQSLRNELDAAVKNITEKLNLVIANLDGLSTLINNKATSIETKIEKLVEVQKTSKWLIISCIIVAIAALLGILLK